MPPNVLSVNLAQPKQNPDARASSSITGIDKSPTADVVQVRAPGSMRGGLGSGLVGDVIGNHKLHGGDDQAVYAYAREDLDAWQAKLGRDLNNGQFGENLTTDGVDVTGARIGERWQIGSGGLVLEVSAPRTPCRTFSAWLAVRGWVKTFTVAAAPGAYLRVITPGPVQAGDQIVITERPDHDVSVGVVFRAVTLEPELLPQLVDIEALAAEKREFARRRILS